MKTGLKGTELAKFLAAQRASFMVEPGMKVGLGTGSTAVWLVKCLGERVRNEGLRFSAAATSVRTAEQATGEGIEVRDLDDLGRLDLTIDGADEIDPNFNLIKGAGGALLREKIVAASSDRMVVIADPSKQVDHLGKFPLPVEVIPFGLKSTERLIIDLLERVDVRSKAMALRMDGATLYVTDSGNHIFDLSLGFIAKPRQLAQALTEIPGVVESGLFIGLCDTAVIGYPDGRTTMRERGGTAENLFDGDAR